MTFVVAIVLFYAGLLLVVIPVHELGHYLVARRFGFKIEEYFVGFGPKLWSTRRGEVEYGVKALPVGGYVKITGMDPFKPVPPEDLPRAYGSKPPWQRALVILAGPLSHFLIAFVLFSTWVLLARIDPYHAARTPLITDVVFTLGGKPSPASEAGLQAGDRIVLYTDGVVESMNAAQEQLGSQKFYLLVKQYAEKESNEFTNLVATVLESHKGEAQQHDDITMVTVKLAAG